MKTVFLRSGAWLSLLLLAGCYISSNGYICGLNEPEIYCDRKIAARLSNPPKSVDTWADSTRTDAMRLQDWVDCGGSWAGEDGLVPLPNGQTRTTEQIQAESRATFYKIQRCMLKKGYTYIGPCYDNKISRPQPACRHRAGEPWEEDPPTQ
jgi:hypothetical protein